jgi:hypothetical protein
MGNFHMRLHGITGILVSNSVGTTDWMIYSRTLFPAVTFTLVQNSHPKVLGFAEALIGDSVGTTHREWSFGGADWFADSLYPLLSNWTLQRNTLATFLLKALRATEHLQACPANADILCGTLDLIRKTFARWVLVEPRRTFQNLDTTIFAFLCIPNRTYNWVCNHNFKLALDDKNLLTIRVRNLVVAHRA